MSKIVDSLGVVLLNETRQLSLRQSRAVRRPAWGYGDNANDPHSTGSRFFIGVRCMLTRDTTVADTPALGLGLCNGKDIDQYGNHVNVPGDSYIQGLVGCRTAETGWTWTDGGANRDYIDSGGNNFVDAYSVGDNSALSTVNSSFISHSFVSGDLSLAKNRTRSFFGCQIEKTTSSTWTVIGFSNTNTTEDVDDTRWESIASGNWNVTSDPNSRIVPNSIGVVSYDEATYGSLDCIYLVNHYGGFDWVICDFRVQRIL